MRTLLLSRFLTCLVLLAWLPPIALRALGAEEPAPPAPPKPADVDAAVQRGVAWLEKTFAAGFNDEKPHDLGEIVMLTLAHAGGNTSQKVFAAGLEFLAATEPRFTYRTAIQAMALSEINPRLYQKKIAHCAQWLVDTQLAGGEWGYPGTVGREGYMPDGVKVAPPPWPEPAAGEKAKPGGATPKVVIARRSSITSERVLKGDFSNTQVAILGLRACREAGVEIPKETWKAALDYLRRFQRQDGGWGYVIEDQQDGASYASLTCAGMCSLAICLNALGTSDVRSDAGLKKALAWLDKNLDPTHNVGVDQSEVLGPSPWQYYHLYSLERIGRVLNVETLGKHAWYAEGARWLLAQQASDGSWADGPGAMGPRPTYLTPADTCFAILFLARATRPITRR
jgi:hypothetical protein